MAQQQQVVPVNGIELCYETFGDPQGEPLLLIMGLGSQLIYWPVELCEALVDRGFFVVRYDNRDTGLSTQMPDTGGEFMTTFLAIAGGEDVDVPYLLGDMAADAVGLLDHLGIASAHVVGASMGGMIAQTVAIEHPTRVRTLTSIMSTTGEPDVGQPTPDALVQLMQPVPTTREAAIESGVATRRTIGSPEALRRGAHPSAVRRGLRPVLEPGRHSPPPPRHRRVRQSSRPPPRSDGADARRPRRPGPSRAALWRPAHR